ncbi:MAG TPA: type II 3-dehydroquinate dehydratase [Longimicrobiales bacterium]|nr:type II 3-dehydroquinate dehydratase [Longimicrobiales bacterium]
MRIAVVHGPNLNLLGQREPELYGTATLAEIDAECVRVGAEVGLEVESFQANAEGALIDYIHGAAPRVAAFVVNAGGYTHTSVALLDALVGVGRPFVEVHLTNLSAREEFRQRSLLAPRASGIIQGFGPAGYALAIRGLAGRLGRAVAPESAAAAL